VRTLALKDRMVFTNCTRQRVQSDHRLLLASNRSCLLLLGYDVIKAHVELPLDLHTSQLCGLVSDCESAAQPDGCLECQYRRAVTMNLLGALPLEIKLVDQNYSSWPSLCCHEMHTMSCEHARPFTLVVSNRVHTL